MSNIIYNIYYILLYIIKIKMFSIFNHLLITQLQKKLLKILYIFHKYN